MLDFYCQVPQAHREENEIENKKHRSNARLGSKKDLRSKLNSYFTVHLAESGEVADIESMADYLGSTRDELMRLMNDPTYGPDLRTARNRIAKIKKQLAFQGKIPATVLSFDLKNNHGYRDKPEESEGSNEQVIFKGKTEDWAK